LNACSLCVRDIRLLDGDTIAALIGLNPNGGGVALCDFGRHKDFAVIAPYFSFVDAASSSRIACLCCSEGNDEFLLFCGICFERTCCLQCTTRNNIAVIVFYSTV